MVAEQSVVQTFDWLSPIVDCLLPGDEKHWPSAASVDLADRVGEFIRQSDDGEQVLSSVFKLTQPAFSTLSRALQIECLQALESNESKLFDRLLIATYNMYYTDPTVRQVIERVTGYEARPPQPKGYPLEPFDETLLNKVRQRNPFWRQENE
ncbi:MAG: hypothetical protein ACI9UN_000949 [Granulosicoccus sp.]|jgi:hypothetical protein